jgi:hypothetical protein
MQHQVPLVRGINLIPAELSVASASEAWADRGLSAAIVGNQRCSREARKQFNVELVPGKMGLGKVK